VGNHVRGEGFKIAGLSGLRYSSVMGQSLSAVVGKLNQDRVGHREETLFKKKSRGGLRLDLSGKGKRLRYSGRIRMQLEGRQPYPKKNKAF